LKESEYPVTLLFKALCGARSMNAEDVILFLAEAEACGQRLKEQRRTGTAFHNALYASAFTSSK